MAIIPLPERGQPVDLTYIYQIVNAINNISSQVSSSTYRYVTVDHPDTGPISQNSSDTRILAVYREVVNNATVSQTMTPPGFTVDIVPPLKSKPIVTATVHNFGDTEAGKSARVIIKTITTNKVEGYLQFNASGDASVGVNVMIVGVPN